MEDIKLLNLLRELSDKNNTYSENIIAYVETNGVASFFKLLCIAEVLLEKNIKLDSLKDEDIEDLL